MINENLTDNKKALKPYNTPNIVHYGDIKQIINNRAAGVADDNSEGYTTNGTNTFGDGVLRSA